MPVDPDPFIELEHVDEAPVYIPSTISVGPLPSCEVDPVTQIIEAGKYVKVADECRRERWVKNVNNSLLTSNNGQVSFDNGADDNPIMLGDLRTAPGLGSVVGLHNNKLSRLVPSGASNQALVYSGGSLSFQTLIQSTLYPKTVVDDLASSGYINFLVEDGTNYEIKKWRATGGSQPKVLTQDPSDFTFSWDKFHDLDHDASSMVMYYWNNTNEMVEKLEPPTLVAGEAYTDYRLSLNASTAAPEWTKVASQVQPAMARYTFNAGDTGASTTAAINISKTYDGGGVSPRFDGLLRPLIKGQVSAIARSQVGPLSSGTQKQCGLFWSLNGQEVANSYGRVFVEDSSAAPASIAEFTGVMLSTDVLTLSMRTEGIDNNGVISAADWRVGSISVHHFPEII